MLVLAVSYASSMRAWLHQRSEKQDLQAQIEQRRADIDALRDQRDRWRDPAYVRTQARERFGWVMPGQVGYRVIGDDGEVLRAGGDLDLVVDEETSPPKAWWEATWQSVENAGQTSGTGLRAVGRTLDEQPADKIDGNGDAVDNQGG